MIDPLPLPATWMLATDFSPVTGERSRFGDGSDLEFDPATASVATLSAGLGTSPISLTLTAISSNLLWSSGYASSVISINANRVARYLLLTIIVGTIVVRSIVGSRTNWLVWVALGCTLVMLGLQRVAKNRQKKSAWASADSFQA